MPLFSVVDLMASWRNTGSVLAQGSQIDFTILGEPCVQNGWRIRWKGLRIPRMYDPRARVKAQLREVLQDAITDHDIGTAPLFREGTELFVTVRYYISARRRKDLDNMSKFLLDAMEGVLYSDDDSIVTLHLSKVHSGEPRTEVVVKLVG